MRPRDGNAPEETPELPPDEDGKAGD
jgi:hypothetical protein